MTLAIFVGVHHLINMILDDLDAPHWYLSHARGYANNAELRMFGGSISSHISEQVSLALLEDDRLATRGLEVRENIDKEVEYVHRLSDYTWQRLAVVSNSIMETVRNNTIRSRLISK